MSKVVLSESDHPPPLPLFVDFSGQPCLIVGAGKVAARKTVALLKSGARLTVVAPICGAAMHELRPSQAMTYHARQYLDEDLCGQRLVVAATDDATLNTMIAMAAKAQGLLVDVANPGHLSNAVIPAVIDRAPLQIALFSGGTSPARCGNYIANWKPLSREPTAGWPLLPVRCVIGSSRCCLK